MECGPERCARVLAHRCARVARTRARKEGGREGGREGVASNRGGASELSVISARFSYDPKI